MVVRAIRESQYFDEIIPIASLLRSSMGRTMVDVGAHHGHALKRFAEAGWDVRAFEPDSVNLAKLTEAWGSAANVRIDPRAVSDVDGLKVNLYRSDISSGISGLSAFHSSHRPAQTVITVTLRTYLETAAVPTVDFLKVDTEGHDLFVLRGFPWEATRPRIVLCEFENRKTETLGYQTKDLLDFLVDHGYVVFISEWFPVVEYGGVHRWQSFGKHPGHKPSDQSWGNIIGVRDRNDVVAMQTRLVRHAAAYRLTSRLPKV